MSCDLFGLVIVKLDKKKSLGFVNFFRFWLFFDGFDYRWLRIMKYDNSDLWVFCMFELFLCISLWVESMVKK